MSDKNLNIYLDQKKDANFSLTINNPNPLLRFRILDSKIVQ